MRSRHAVMDGTGGGRDFEQVFSAFLSHSLRTAPTAALGEASVGRTWAGFITAVWRPVDFIFSLEDGGPT